jgi:hypothetical protein
MACLHRFPPKLSTRSATLELGKALELAAQEVATVKGCDGEKPRLALVITEALEGPDPLSVRHHGLGDGKDKPRERLSLT